MLTIPLSEYSKGDGDEGTVEVALGLEHVEKAGLRLESPLHL